ncbi:hypothetical protein [Cellulosimicrobium sp. CUA-896]|uniref:hypothetical protein n=1 Tax=Cellulosimicrobium sp. CUA-896 TaxID=1517881 RepID=UPI00095C4A1F|nr:hypothetical protein [Cellulosimicrobium sp. CUA-896]OLT50548.1 hypothetical protein BJF88_15305 [Cellulosimicrobium sp. CUA-896]
MAHHASPGDAPAVDPAHITHAARDTLSVRRVFGESYERDGTLVIPVATVWGGTGSGWGSGSGELSGNSSAQRRRAAGGTRGAPAREDEAGAASTSEDGPGGDAGGEGSGGGGGFGVRVNAKGVFVVDDAGVRWQPAIDVNRVILGGQALGAVVAVACALAWAVGRLRR